MLRILLVSILSIGVIGAIGIYTIYEKAGNYLLEQMLETQITQTILEEAGINLNEPVREMTEEEIGRLEESTIDALGEQSAIGSDKGIEPSNEVAEKKGTSVQGESKIEEKPNTKPVTTGDLQKMVEQQVKEITKVVPSKDKRAMTQLVVSNLAMSDINYLVQLAIDGISTQDLAEAKQIAYRSFDTQEIEQVRMYYNQYKHLIP